MSGEPLPRQKLDPPTTAIQLNRGGQDLEHLLTPPFSAREFFLMPAESFKAAKDTGEVVCSSSEPLSSNWGAVGEKTHFLGG